MKKLIAFAIAAMLAISCASIPAKQRATVTLQSFETALGEAQDFELANHTILGLDAAASATDVANCQAVSKLVLPAGATKHQVVQCFFYQAFNVEAIAATQLQNWQPGIVPPTAVCDLESEVTVLLGFAKATVGGSKAQTFITDVQTVFTNITNVASLVGLSNCASGVS